MADWRIVSKSRTVIAVLAALLLATALYWPALGSPFVYDDWSGVANNPALMSWAALGRFLSAPVGFSREFLLHGGSFYRPAYWASVALDRHLWGLQPIGYHLANLLVHVCNMLLLWRYLRDLKFTWKAAALATALWASLAVNSETVIWISARAYGMVTCWILLSQLAVLRYAKCWLRKWIAAYACCFAVALTCHELAVVIFPLTALTLWVSETSLRERATKELLAVGGAVALLYLIAYQLLLASASELQAWGVAATFFKYLSLIAWPLHLSVERSTDTPPAQLNGANIVAWLVLIALGTFVFRIRKPRPKLFLGAVWLMLFLLPFSGVVPLYQGMAERYLYPASIGFAIVLLALAEMVTPRIAIAGVLIFAFNGWRTLARANDWRSEEALYTSSLTATPKSSVLLFNLGTLYQENGNPNRAATYFQRAIAANSRYERAYVGLGNAKLALGDTRGAQTAYVAALAVDNEDIGATLNLGALYQRTGDLPQAESQYRKAIQLEPNRAEGWINLGAVLLEQGRAEEATTKLVKAVSLDRRNPTAYFNLGAALEQSEQATVAASMYQKAIELKPDYAAAKLALRRLQNADSR